MCPRPPKSNRHDPLCPDSTLLRAPPVKGSTMKNFSSNIPTRILQFLLGACFVLPLAACNKEEAPKAVEKAPVPAQTTDDIVEWRAYVSDVVRRNMGAIEIGRAHV